MNKEKRIIVQKMLKEKMRESLLRSYSQGDTLEGCGHRHLIGIHIGGGIGARDQ